MTLKRKRSYELELNSIYAEKQDKTPITVQQDSALEILSSTLDGKFNASSKTNSTFYLKIREGEELTIKNIFYRTPDSSTYNIQKSLNFKEYIEEEKPLKLIVEETLFLTKAG
jgi:hypothetical protein